MLVGNMVLKILVEVVETMSYGSDSYNIDLELMMVKTITKKH